VTARVVQVNVGTPITTEWLGRPVTSGIWKHPVAGPVRVEGVNLAGDDQADRRVHGGPDKAVYAYSVEDYEWWGVEPPSFGENLTTEGIDLRACHIGDRWRVGSAVLEVAQPRQPCFKLGMRMGDEQFPGRFEAAERAGAYLRIVEAGSIEAGDGIAVEPTTLPATPLSALAAVEIDESTLVAVVDDPRVPDGWRRTAARYLSR
jgi:MOSC domain-containing protein YiiM